jgi:hypothetical protein
MFGGGRYIVVARDSTGLDMIAVIRTGGFPTREASAMSITRRDALAVVIGCGLTTTSADDEKPAATGPPRDPVLSGLPPAVRKVFTDTFPNHRCIRLARRGQGAAAVYRGTFFDHTIWSSTEVRQVGEESIATPPLYHLELDAAGRVLEETSRWIDPKRLPQAVRAAYDKWNPRGVEGRSGHFWQTEVGRGKARVYRVSIILSAVKAYRASFGEDGTVVEADPAVLP